jgi:hypothetical protein
MNPHRISTKVPVDTPVGQEMVIFRSSRGKRRHDKVVADQTVVLYRGRRDLASCKARKVTTHIRFRDISNRDIQDGYWAGGRTRQNLLNCLQTMYEEYDEDTPTTVIRCLRTG